MIWAILIGNTRTVSALMKGDKILKRVIVPTSHLRKSPEVLRWVRSIRKSSDVEGLIVASVVPPVDKAVRNSIRKSFGMKPIFVTSKSPLGIGVKVKKANQVGADRLANAVAVNEIYGAPSIVVDFGTGTTFDVVDGKGAYCGGAILPGIGISLRALNDFTAKIPLVKFGPVTHAIGKTTEEAVRSGVYHGAIGTTRELLSRIRQELRTEAPAIATGGWCKVFKKSGLFQRIEPDLTFLGLSLIWHNAHA